MSTIGLGITGLNSNAAACHSAGNVNKIDFKKPEDVTDKVSGSQVKDINAHSKADNIKPIDPTAKIENLYKTKSDSFGGGQASQPNNGVVGISLGGQGLFNPLGVAA